MSKTESVGSLSLDARVVLTAWFRNGLKDSVLVGGVGAENEFTDRCRTAIDELVGNGYVTVTPYNDLGRLEYRGTDKEGQRLDLSEIMAMESWPLTRRIGG